MVLAKTLGYGSPKQVAGRRAFVLYENVCALRPDEENVFWQRGMCVPRSTGNTLDAALTCIAQITICHPHFNPSSPLPTTTSGS